MVQHAKKNLDTLQKCINIISYQICRNLDLNPNLTEKMKKREYKAQSQGLINTLMGTFENLEIFFVPMNGEDGLATYIKATKENPDEGKSPNVYLPSMLIFPASKYIEDGEIDNVLTDLYYTAMTDLNAPIGIACVNEDDDSGGHYPMILTEEKACDLMGDIGGVMVGAGIGSDGNTKVKLCLFKLKKEYGEG